MTEDQQSKRSRLKTWITVSILAPFGALLLLVLLLLVPDYLHTREVLFSSLDPNEPPERILYFPAPTNPDAANTIILAAPQPGRSGKRSIVLLNGAAEIADAEKFERLIESAKRRETNQSIGNHEFVGSWK